MPRSIHLWNDTRQQAEEGCHQPFQPSRRKAVTLFNPNKYALSDIIEGIFGAEETRGHQIYCRFVDDDNRKRFSKWRAISWNIMVLNRFRWANRLDMPIPSYGAPPEAVHTIALPINILPVGLAHKSLLKTWHRWIVENYAPATRVGVTFYL